MKEEEEALEKIKRLRKLEDCLINAIDTQKEVKEAALKFQEYWGAAKGAEEQIAIMQKRLVEVRWEIADALAEGLL